MHRRIITKKCDWGRDRNGVPYRKGGALTLSEFQYDDGNEGYRITATGLDMMDNFRRNQYPTNIDLKNMTQKEAMNIYEELLTGPSRELSKKVRTGELEGWSPNLYGGQYEEGKVAQTINSPFLSKSVIGGDGIFAMDPDLIREETKRRNMSEDQLIKNIVAHEFDHQEKNRINRQLLMVNNQKEKIFDDREKEIIASKKGAEAMLKGGYTVNTEYLIDSLMLYKHLLNFPEVLEIVSSWMKEWSDEYEDLLIVSTGQDVLNGIVYDNYDIAIPRYKEIRDKYVEEDSLRALNQKEIDDWYSDDDLREETIRNGTYDPSDDYEDGTEFNFSHEVGHG